MMKYDVFISYSRKDYVDANENIIPGNIVSGIRGLFDTNGISYWFDETGIYSGDEFAGLIAKNIKESRIFLFISSEQSNKSPWTSSEIATARAYKKKIIPFRYDDSAYNESVIIYIANLDFIEYPKNKDKALQKLLTSIQQFIKAENEQKELEKQEAERRRLEEISLQEKNAQILELKTKLVTLENRKAEIEQDLLEHEKTKATLQNDLRITDINISALREQINALVGTKTIEHSPQKESIEKLTPSEWVGIFGMSLLTGIFAIFIVVFLWLINFICKRKGRQVLIKPKFISVLFVCSIISIIVWFMLLLII